MPPALFDHVTIRAADREASERFYDTVLAALGVAKSFSAGWLAEWGDFSLSPAEPGRPATRRLHVGFGAPSRAHVDAFWQAGRAAGHPDAGAPGPRPEYAADYYGAFLLDPDGNSAEAVHNASVRPGATVDHVWVRVADLAASRRFYLTIAPFAGLEPGTERPGRVQLRARGGSFSLVEEGPPTKHAHLAFPAAEDETVRAFHRAATAAGHRDHGAPGLRPRYHPGYYAAFALDPDGTNVELVCHHR